MKMLSVVLHSDKKLKSDYYFIIYRSIYLHKYLLLYDDVKKHFFFVLFVFCFGSQICNVYDVA